MIPDPSPASGRDFGDAVIKVVIVDDDALVRTGLAMILRGDASLDIVGEASDGLEGVSLVRQTQPHVVLMDIRMPRLDGLEAVARVRALPSPPAVIMLTTFAADEYVVRALREGATGFLLKDTAPAAIVEAVHRVAAGHPMLSPSVTRQLIKQVSGAESAETADRAAAARQALSDLTQREFEVAVAIGQGKSNADISRELYMSVATVKAHVSRILTKLGFTNRVQVAIAVHDAGLA